jgi:hypothetical protein
MELPEKGEIEVALESLGHGLTEILPGLVDEEFGRLEEALNIVFPRDLRYLLSIGVPIGKSFPNWRHESVDELRRWMDAPTDGILGDVERGEFWFDNWGERPSEPNDARALARQALAHVPNLIPVFAHRFLPGDSPESGSPVFSAVQSDVIFYGMNLWEYLRREFRVELPDTNPPLRWVPFWSDLAMTWDRGLGPDQR